MNSRILVIGDANIDVIIHDLKSIPEMGKEVFVDDIGFRLGGGAANVAVGLAKLGADVSLYTNLGIDLHGQYIEESLKQSGVDLSLAVKVAGVPTGISVSISDGSDRLFISSMGTNRELNPSYLKVETLGQFDHVHFAIFSNRMIQSYMNAVRNARKAGCGISLDIGWTNEEINRNEILCLLKNVDVFFPNYKEAQILFEDETEMDKLGKELLQYVRKAVVITNGSEGSTVYYHGQKLHKSYPARAIDAVGAGDAFDAGFLAGYIRNMSMETCLDYGSACGSIVVSRIGGGNTVPDKETLEKYIQKQKE